MTGKEKDRDRRGARLAEALRANLAKRKTQARSRRDGKPDARPEGLMTPAARPGAGKD